MADSSKDSISQDSHFTAENFLSKFCLALNNQDQIKARYLFAHLHKMPEVVQKRSIMELVKYDAEFALDQLTGILNESSSPFLQEWILFGLKALAHPKSIPVLLAFSRWKDEKVAIAAVNALAEIGSNDAVEGIADLLEVSESALRSVVMDRLRCLGPRSINPLLMRLKASSSDGRIHALTLLGEIGDGTVTKQIIKVLPTLGIDANVRFAAFEAIGKLPQLPEGSRALAAGLMDSSEQVRLAALQAMDRNLSEPLLKGIKTALSRNDQEADALISLLLAGEASMLVMALMEDEVFRRMIFAHVNALSDSESRRYLVELCRKEKRSSWIEFFQEGVPEEIRVKRIFVIDDSRLMLALYRKTFQSSEFAMEGFERATKLLMALEAAPPELLITDLNMPEMNGLELTRLVRHSFSSKELPVLMVTTQQGETLEADALDAGVTGIMAKPFTPETLIVKVEGLIEKNVVGKDLR